MLVTVSFDKNDEQTVMDILLSKERNYKLFCSGTIESIALNYGINCSKCNEIFNENEKSRINYELLVIYASESKAATLELLCILAETGVTKVQTTLNLSSFFAAKKLECNDCKQEKDSEAIHAPPRKMIKMEPDVNMETTKAEETVTSTVWTKSEPQDSDDEELQEEFVTFNDPNEDFTPAPSNGLQGISIWNPSPAIPPHSGFKAETRRGRTFVENQERSQNEVTTVSKVVNENVNENSSGNVTIEQASAASSSIKSPSTPVQIHGEGVQKGEEQCQICNKTLKVTANREYKVNMTFSMQSHSRIHIAANPFQCRMCNYECRFASMMKKHFQKRHSSVKPTFNDVTSDADYKEEVLSMANQCFPAWVPTSRRDSLGKGNKRLHEG